MSGRYGVLSPWCNWSSPTRLCILRLGAVFSELLDPFPPSPSPPPWGLESAVEAMVVQYTQSSVAFCSSLICSEIYEKVRNEGINITYGMHSCALALQNILTRC